MKIYKFVSNYPYSGGCLLVAANRRSQAVTIAKKLYSDDLDYENVELMKTIQAAVATPQVIINVIYIE